MDLSLVVWVILPLNVIFAIIIVFFERKDPTEAIAWLVLLFLLPPVGFVLYLLLGQNYTRQKMFVVKEHDDRSFLREIFAEQQRRLTDRNHRFATREAERFQKTISLLLQNNQAYLTEGNRVEIFTQGEDKFEALFRAIREARHHIHLEYFVINNDELGRAGGKIGAFFPSIYRVNYRNHRKIAIIDGVAGFIGGFNIGDDYLGKGPLGYWRDTALQVVGPAAWALQLRFFLDWNYTTGEGLRLNSHYFPDTGTPGTTPIQIVSSGPDTRWSPIKDGYINLINSARESVYIQTPYFIPDDSVTDALRIAALSGVDVRIMIPCKPDHIFVYWATLSFIGDLLEAGVRAYTYDAGFLHAKTIVVDREAGSVGSANWDVRSFRLNFEANAFFYDAAVGAELAGAFEEDLSVCTEITLENYRARPIEIRLKESISRLFSPLA